MPLRELTELEIESLRPEERALGKHDITCPGSDKPKLLIVTSEGFFVLQCP